MDAPGTSTDERRAYSQTIVDIKTKATALATKVDTLHADVQEVKEAVQKVQSWTTDNAEVTRDIKAILESFKILTQLSKWMATVTTYFAGLYIAYKTWTGK